MLYNPNILNEILRARSLTQRELSSRLGLRLDELQDELDREPEPKQSLLNRISDELRIPSFAFYMERSPALEEAIPDFRSETPVPRPWQKATLRAIQVAEGIQKIAIENDLVGTSSLPELSMSSSNDIEKSALAARSYFEITPEDQVQAKDAMAFYSICRKKIEDKGIYVLQDSFPEDDGSGFCLAHPKHPVIVINTRKQTRGRRLFTLIHELAHVLLHKSGVSDPFVNENSTERFCNKFAGNFLVPRSYLSALLKGVTPTSTPDLDDVRWASRRLKISQEASVLRLEELGIYGGGSYDQWKRVIHNLGNPDFSEGGGGGEPPPQEKVKLAKYGFRFAETFDELLRDGRISGLNLYRVSGLKPKYVRAYFDYAKSLTSNEQFSLSIDDG